MERATAEAEAGWDGRSSLELLRRLGQCGEAEASRGGVSGRRKRSQARRLRLCPSQVSGPREVRVDLPAGRTGLLLHARRALEPADGGAWIAGGLGEHAQRVVERAPHHHTAVDELAGERGDEVMDASASGRIVDLHGP